MRYSVIAKDLTVTQVYELVKRYGGRNIAMATLTRQVFCDLEPAGVAGLEGNPGLAVKPVTTIKHQQIATQPVLQDISGAIPATYGASQASLANGFYQFRETFSPPVLGRGATIVILDTGIRKKHEALKDKVVYEENFTSSPTVEDVFDHGTGVAYLAAGGRHGAGEESGLAPEAYLWNIKVLGDNGEGTEEAAVMAIERVYQLDRQAYNAGLPISDPMKPSLINMSWGTPDIGDPDDPIRAAIRAIRESGEPHLPFFFAAAGNFGPNPETITCPACDPYVLACGAATFVPFSVWDYSSRGPTKEGLVKPDVAGHGVRTLTASCRSDSAYEVKSGTSFSCPVVVGSTAVVWEALRRMEGEDYAPTWEEFLQMIPPLAVKPEGAPSGKDNDYGYGTLNGLAAIARGQAAYGGGVLQLLPMVMLAGMMPMIMKNM